MKSYSKKVLFLTFFLLALVLIFVPVSLCAENSVETEDMLGTALITDLDAEGNLIDEYDYAGYGALQILTQIGAEYTVEPLSVLEDKEVLLNYQTVIMPSLIEDEDILDHAVKYVDAGGTFISGGMDVSRDEPGVEVIDSSEDQVPEIAASFTHKSEHPILENIHADGMPVLIPYGMSSYPILTSSGDAEGFGSVEFGNNVGDALIINEYGEGLFITYGVNPFAAAGYGMGMVTEPLEERHEWPDHIPDEEYYKSFNWKTARSIKEEFISEQTDDVNLIWGDEYGHLVRNSLLWANEKQDSALIWQWLWPDLAPFAASLQHDWDAGREDDAQVFRELEEAYGVKSGLYILLRHNDSYRFLAPEEARRWYEGGWEIGFHADRSPAREDFKQQMEDDIQAIVDEGIPREEIRGGCHHFLRYYREAPLWWEELGLEYDTTFYDMDWKQPFFTGTSLPYYLKHGTSILSVHQLPSRISDGVMTANNRAYYLGDDSDMSLVKERIEDYIDTVAKVHGHASWNAHPARRRVAGAHGVDMQVWFMEHALEKQAWFPRPVDVSRWYRGISELDKGITSWDGEKLKIAVTSENVTVPLPLEDYALLVPQKAAGRTVEEVTVDGNQINTRSFSFNNWEMEASVFDITGDHEVVITYGN